MGLNIGGDHTLTFYVPSAKVRVLKRSGKNKKTSERIKQSLGGIISAPSGNPFSSFPPEEFRIRLLAWLSAPKEYGTWYAVFNNQK